jgi:hypothetical protein
MASVNENETYVNDQLQKYFEKKYIKNKIIKKPLEISKGFCFVVFSP